MTKKEVQKYNRLSRRIVRRLRVTRAEVMWVWTHRVAYQRWYAAQQSAA